MEHLLGRLHLASELELSDVLLEIANLLRARDGQQAIMSQSDARELSDAIAERIQRSRDPRARAACIHVLSQFDRDAAANLAKMLLPEAVGRLKAWNSLLHEAVQALAMDGKNRVYSSGLPDIEKTLRHAEDLLSERSIFVPW